MKAPGCSSLAYVCPALISSISLLAFDLHSAQTAGTNVSYYQQIRPILQANCQGCHQPAKSKGGYVMTDFKRLLSGGESEGVAIAPGHPDKSAILKMITPQDGEVRMPKGKTPLDEIEVALLTAWIQQGATDDTPADARKRIMMLNIRRFIPARPWFHPSIFRPMANCSPMTGFHEVLLYDAAGSNLVARLVGLSERVQSIRFSPDAQWLAAVGGDPARAGEIQVWDVEKRKLTVSAPITYDTLYGVSWSPDSKLIAFGCADNTVRAIEAVQANKCCRWVRTATGP